jgi:hypothetical protein
MRIQQCRSCRAPIVWAVNERTKKRAPIDAEPVEDGPVYFTHNPGDGGDPEYRVLTKEQRSAGVPGFLHTNHFQTCPNAAQHVKDRRR